MGNKNNKKFNDKNIAKHRSTYLGILASRDNDFDRDELYNRDRLTGWESFAWDCKSDEVNHPSHYTGGNTEAIDVIEDAIKNADNPVEGMLQGQALKYLLRMWLKGNCIQDARKAQWYLNRLVEKLTASEEQ